jgi:hypothetical protein
MRELRAQFIVGWEELRHDRFVLHVAAGARGQIAVLSADAPAP